MKKVFLIFPLFLFSQNLWGIYLEKEVIDSYLRYDNQKAIQYIKDERERVNYQLFIRNGLIYNSRGQLFHTDGKRALFVMDKEGQIYGKINRNPGILQNFHHTSFLAGSPAASAGEITVDTGKLIEITDSSGHYRPSLDYFLQFFEELMKQGMVINNTKLVLTNFWGILSIRDNQIYQSTNKDDFFQITKDMSKYTDEFIQFLGDSYVQDYQD